MSENQFERSNMTDVAECSELIKGVVSRDHRSVKDWINTTARRLGWEYGRTRDIWYANARRIDGFEKEQLKAVKAKRQAEQERNLSRAEYKTLKDRIARLEAALAISDAEHSEPFRAGLQQSMGGFRGMDDAGDGE